MKTYDCFTFFNELDLLELRLAEMSPYVDFFVIAEAPVTFQGQPKPLYFADNRARFAQYADKLRYILVDDMPATEDPWVREHFQRDALKRGLHDAQPDDIVVIADVDELYTAQAIAELKARQTLLYIEMKLFVYYLNCEVISGSDVPWIKTYGAPWRMIEKIEDLSIPRTPPARHHLRDMGLGSLKQHLVKQGGWHFSWLGNTDRLIAKISAFSHTESKMQKMRDPNVLKNAIANRRFFATGGKVTIRPIDKNFPRAIRAAQARYLQDNLLLPPDPPTTWLQRLKNCVSR